MEPTREQFYQRRIAQLEAQNAALQAEVAERIEQNAKLAEQVAKLSKNSSNSSKPPSSDIVKPPKDKGSNAPRRQGGQRGHLGVNRHPFSSDRVDQTVELQADACDCGHCGGGEAMDQPRVHQVAELREDPIIVTEYRLHGFVCPQCGRTVWGELPPGVIEGSAAGGFGPRLQALIGYMKGSLHASYSGLEAF